MDIQKKDMTKSMQIGSKCLYGLDDTNPLQAQERNNTSKRDSLASTKTQLRARGLG